MASGPKGERTRAAILDAAIVRFGREGYRSAKVADIARDAGVGGTVVYAYFPNKEALFIEALDHDAALVIDEGTSSVLNNPPGAEWRTTLIITLLESVDRHPLARRVLSGFEPEVTERMTQLPALTELRKTVAERLRVEQAAGLVRGDIDPVSVAGGSVTIVLALMMWLLQFGREGIDLYGPDVLAVFAAALDPPGQL